MRSSRLFAVLQMVQLHPRTGSTLLCDTRNCICVCCGMFRQTVWWSLRWAWRKPCRQGKILHLIGIHYENTQFSVARTHTHTHTHTIYGVTFRQHCCQPYRPMCVTYPSGWQRARALLHSRRIQEKRHIALQTDCTLNKTWAPVAVASYGKYDTVRHLLWWKHDVSGTGCFRHPIEWFKCFWGAQKRKGH